MKNVWRSRCRLQWEGWTAGPRPLSASLHKKWSSSQDFRFLSTSFFFQFFISFTFTIINIIPVNIALLHSILPILILIFFISFLLCTPLLHPYHDRHHQRSHQHYDHLVQSRELSPGPQMLQRRAPSTAGSLASLRLIIAKIKLDNDPDQLDDDHYLWPSMSLTKMMVMNLIMMWRLWLLLQKI